MRKSTRTEISFRCKQQPGVIFSAVQRSVHAIDNLNILVSKTQRSSLRTPWKLIDGKSRKIEVINRNSQVSIYHQLMMVIKKRLSASLIGCSGWWQEMVPREFVSIPFYPVLDLTQYGVLWTIWVVIFPTFTMQRSSPIFGKPTVWYIRSIVQSPSDLPCSFQVGVVHYRHVLAKSIYY